MKKLVPKILIAIPTYEGKNYCLDEFLENIKKFDYPKNRIEIFIADNSKTNANAKYINKKYKIKVFWKDYDGYSVFEKLADTHNQLRRHFLESDCDYMFHLESDIFPPKNILWELLWANKPIVNGLYQIFDGAWRTPCIALFDDKHESSNDCVFYYTIDTFSHWFIEGKVQQTFIAGIGCCLMTRKIMEKFNFKSGIDNKPPDSYFAEDLRVGKQKNWVHTGILSYHWNLEDWGRHSEYITDLKSE